MYQTTSPHLTSSSLHFTSPHLTQFKTFVFGTLLNVSQAEFDKNVNLNWLLLSSTKIVFTDPSNLRLHLAKINAFSLFSYTDSSGVLRSYLDNVSAHHIWLMNYMIEVLIDYVCLQTATKKDNKKASKLVEKVLTGLVLLFMGMGVHTPAVIGGIYFHIAVMHYPNLSKALSWVSAQKGESMQGYGVS